MVQEKKNPLANLNAGLLCTDVNRGVKRQRQGWGKVGTRGRKSNTYRGKSLTVFTLAKKREHAESGEQL